MIETTTQTSASAAARFASLVVRYPRIVIALVLTLCLLCVLGARYLTQNPDNRVFFSEDNPHLQALESLEKTYTRTDNVYIAIEPKSGSVFTRDALQTVIALTERSWQIPYSSRVDSLSNFQWIRADGDDLLVTDLVESDRKLTDAYIENVKTIATGKEVLVNRLLSADGNATGINVTILKPDDDRDAVYEVNNFVRSMLDDMRRQYPDVRFYLTGRVVFDVAFAELPGSENATLVPLMFALTLLIVSISLRSLWATISTLVLMALSVAIAMGLSGWAGAVLSAGTTGAPVIIMTLSIAHCVHIVVTTRQKLAAGMPYKQAIVESIRINFTPVFITSATTAIGFLTLNFSDAPPFRLLGNVVATGVLAAFVLAVTLLPAILALVRIRPAGTSSILQGCMNALANFVVRYRNLLLPTMALLIIGLGAGVSRITLDDNFIQYFGEKLEVRQHTDFVEENLTGLNAIEFSLPADADGGISDPVYLKRVDAFIDWLKEQAKITNVIGFPQVMKDLNQSMHGDDPAYNRVPESRQLAAQYLLLYEMSLPYGLDLNNTIDVAKSQSRVVALFQGTSSAELRTINKRAEQWLQDNSPQIYTVGSGLSIVFAYISGRNIQSMLFGSLLALVLISFILIFALRSLRFGLVSLIPNLVPAAMALGLWGYLSGEVGLSVAIVVALTLGIVVDDTVHFLSKYLRARREQGLSPAAAVTQTFQTAGVALWITSITLVTGFMVLFLSDFQVNSQMGILSAITIALALFADFLFLPPLLLRLDNDGGAED